MTVTADDDISNQATKVKMTVYIGFVELCTAVSIDFKISSQATEVNMAVHKGFKSIAKVSIFSVEKGYLCYVWHVNVYFRNQNIMQRGDPMELNLEGTETQK